MLIRVFFQEITNVQAHYERIKQALHVSASVSVTPVNLTAQLKECAVKFQQWKENKKASVETRDYPYPLFTHTLALLVTAKCCRLFGYVKCLQHLCILHAGTEAYKFWHKSNGKHSAVRGGSSHVGQQQSVFGAINTPIV